MRDQTVEETVHETSTTDPRRTTLLAYEFWRARGCPDGSPEDDWFLAEEQLRHQQSLPTQ